MDRDSTGETPSVLCPRQAAGLPNNLFFWVFLPKDSSKFMKPVFPYPP